MRRPTVLLLSLALIASAKKSDDVKSPKQNETTNVIVLFRTKPSDKHHGKVTGNGGKVRGKFDNMDIASYEVNAKALDDLDKDDDVVSITPDRPVQGHANMGEGNGAIRRWQLDSWYNQQPNPCRGCLGGVPVGVAVIDSGMTTKSDFNWWNTTTSRIVYQQSFIDSSTSDLYGHGTHVAGIIGAEGNVSCLQPGLDSTGNCKGDAFFGVAAGVQFVSLKVLDANGVGTDSAVIAAIDKAISLKSTYNIRVINLSLGRPVKESYKTDPLCQAVERAWTNGIVVVVSAGNEGRNNSANTKGYGTISAPGNDPLVITVGALYTGQDWTDSNDRPTTYTSKGPTAIDQIAKPDILAPGNNIVSEQAAGSKLVTLYPGNRPAISSYWPWVAGTTASSDYFALNGTSMATPFVSGAAALLIDRDRSLTPDQVKARLMKYARRGIPRTVSVYDTPTAQWFSVKSDIFTVGAGILDANAAFMATDKPTGSAASPKASYNSTTKKVTLNYAATGGTNVVWSDTGAFASNVVWGENIVAGSNVVWSDNVVWGENVVWGDTTVSGFNVVWGSAASITGSPNATALALLANGDK
ncbi:MAG: S8 family serine peptidase [Bryobacteraceae bacterium]